MKRPSVGNQEATAFRRNGALIEAVQHGRVAGKGCCKDVVFFQHLLSSPSPVYEENVLG